MKTTINSRISLALLSVLIVLTASAQKDFNNESAYRFSSQEFNAPSFFDNNANATVETGSINEKALKHLKKEFSDVSNAKWFQLNDKLLAKFSNNETSNRILFDKHGKIIYMITYGSEKQLPVDIKKSIASKYENCTITSVIKVLEDNREIWVVKLAGKSNYVAARVEDGEIEEVENFQKAM